ncbi:hypothetical protein Q9966_004557 [Columba livia]|nr:hypothetical protein Q9966_004557 [Columba livia]
MRRRRRRRASWTPSSSTCPAHCRICSRSNSTANPAMGCWGTGALSLPTPPSSSLGPNGGPHTPSPSPSAHSPDQTENPPRPVQAGPPHHAVPKGSSPGWTERTGTKCTDATSWQAGGTPGPTSPPGVAPRAPCPPCLSQGTPAGLLSLAIVPSTAIPLPHPALG